MRDRSGKTVHANRVDSYATMPWMRGISLTPTSSLQRNQFVLQLDAHPKDLLPIWDYEGFSNRWAYTVNTSHGCGSKWQLSTGISSHRGSEVSRPLSFLTGRSWKRIPELCFHSRYD